MILTKHGPRMLKALADKFRVYSWSALTVTIEAHDLTETNKTYHIEFTKEELLAMLGKIEQREQEIKNLNEGRGMYENT